jgi:hypothetical protein
MACSAWLSLIAPSVTMPAAPRTWARSARISPHLLDRALLRVQAAARQRPAVLGEEVLAERHVAKGPGEAHHLPARPGGVQPVERDGVEAPLAQLRRQGGGADLAEHAQQVGRGVGGPGRAGGAVGGLTLRVVRVRHRAGRR